MVLWTHAKVPNSTAPVNLTWQISADDKFAVLVNSGKLMTAGDTSFTAKVDATGLTAGSTYFYRFMDEAGVISPVGTTRTLPAAGVTSVKFAVFSCALYSEGFFNAYDAAAKSDAQYAVHLGDYLYEYGSEPATFGNKDAVTLGRVTVPANDMVSLDDYRTRYALYRSDMSLQALHAKMPWTTRKSIAARVHHEWMPIRTPDASNLLKIYRRFDFGNLFSLHMVDTRIEGRDQQYDNFGDTDGGIGRYVTGLTTGTGAGQPGHHGALTPTQAGLLNPSVNPCLPYNLDSWDGYPSNREAVLQTVKAQGKKLVALSGDSHNAWFTNLTTLTGEKVGVEFATSSVTAPGFESFGLGALASSLDGSVLTAQLGNAVIGAGLGLIDDLNYSETNLRGYLQMTITAAQVKGEFVFVSTVKSRTYTSVVGKTITVPALGAVTYA